MCQQSEPVANLPERKPMNHRGPLSVDITDAVYFVTVAALNRDTDEFVKHAEQFLSSARYYQEHGNWFLYLFLLMPDHLHMLVHVPPGKPLADVIGAWKGFLFNQYGIRFQKNFFDTRIRNDEHFREKWNYICRNPSAKGLVASPREWPHSIAFNRETGEEIPHR